MAASGARGARVATGAAAVVLAALVALRPLTEGGARAGTLAAAGAAGVVLLLLAVALARGPLVAWGLIALAAQYAGGLAGREGAIDAGAPFVATALLLVAELGYWSVELAGTGREEAAVALRRLAALGVLAAGALALAGLVLAATAIPLAAAAGWNAVGIAAAAAVLALIARLARKPDAEATK
ncbi:MAG TPA: hypothetical protein VLB86_04815 [Gaiellaceae bacterium]|nr:hypothetical protein [Gaiellaceae bacterium]